MVEVERVFLETACQLGLNARREALLIDVDRAIVEYGAGPDRRHLQRLHDQREKLRSPCLSTVAALVVSLCEEDPRRCARIRPAFDRLVQRHGHLRRLYARLPSPQGMG